MATRVLTRYPSLLSTKQSLATFLSRSFSSSSSATATSSSFLSLSQFSFLRRFRPLSAVPAGYVHQFPPSVRGGIRALSTRQTQSSLNDSSPNWSNRPPKETILLDGCDFEHWLVVMEKPDDSMTRDDIINWYIQTLSQVVGSEEEARMKIYSVSTKHYFAFGALVSEELSYKLKELPKVRWVLPDSYLDVKNKDYGGEPFINGQAVPYDPKYHEEWVRNNQKAMERNRRNDRPRNSDRSRNFERRRQNMQNQGPPMYNQGPMQNQGPAMYNQGPMQNQGPPVQSQGPPMPNQGPLMQDQGPPAPGMGRPGPQNNMSGPAQYNRMPPNNMGGPPNAGWGSGAQNSANLPNTGGMQHQNLPPGPAPNYRAYPPNDMGGPSGGNSYEQRDMPGRDMPASPPPNYQ